MGARLNTTVSSARTPRSLAPGPCLIGKFALLPATTSVLPLYACYCWGLSSSLYRDLSAAVSIAVLLPYYSLKYPHIYQCRQNTIDVSPSTY